MFRNLCLGGILVFILCPFFGICQSKTVWNIQPSNIQTRWAKNVNPINPLSEYPRPQMVREHNWQNLNGLWSYTITSRDAPMPSGYQEYILVPYPLESALSGVKRQLLPTENLWYRRMFQVNRKDDQRILLHFGAVDWQSTVYINGKEVGSHNGGYTGFSFDISDFLVPGNNELVVKVFDPTDRGIGPHGKQVLTPGNIYYTSSSGIWQTVWIETVPTIHITDLKFTPDIEKKRLDLRVDFSDSTYDKAGISIEAVVFSEGKELSVLKRNYSKNLTVSLKVPNPRLWSPDDPFLYDLTVRLKYKGQVVDEVVSYFGMRKIATAKDSNGVDRIFLNNKYYYNLGTLDQGFWPEGLYTAPTDSALLFDIQVIKAMGFNTIRKHIKVEPARWYYYADKLGLLVWQDLVNPNQGLPEGSKAEFEKESAEILSQLHNYPSITTWVLFNEKWGQYDQGRLTTWIKQMDPSRLVNGHSGELLYVNNQLRSPSANPYLNADMTDVHAYPAPMLSIKLPNKAQVLGEFGGIGVPIEGHLWDDLVTGWGYDGLATPALMYKQYSRMIDSLEILEKQGLSGSIYTQPFDVESEQNGLLTYDRSVIKLSIDTIRRLNARLWPTTKNYQVVTRDISAIVADTINSHYSSRLEDYERGRRDSVFLRSLAIMAYAKKDTENINKIADQYIHQIRDPFCEMNLRFIRQFASSSSCAAFDVLYRNRDKVDQTLGRNSAENTIMNVIYKEEIAPYERQVNPDWGAIERKVVSKYGELGEERIWGNMMVYYAVGKDWNNFGKYYKLYFDRVIPEGRSFIHINNISWLVFEHISDTAILQTAIKATRYNLDFFVGNDPESIDTHANLLYKIGKKQEAIEWEHKAVEVSNEEKVFVNTLDKMKKGFPTWD